MLEKFKYHLKARGPFGTVSRFINCWQVNGFSYTIRQIFRPLDRHKLIQSTVSLRITHAAPADLLIDHKDASSYFLDARAQDIFFEKYKKDPVERRMVDLVDIFKKEKQYKKVILYPLSYDASIKQRPEHILRVLAREGYLCLIMHIPENHTRSKVEKIGQRLYITDLFDECIAYFADKQPIVYITYPFYSYLTKHFPKAYFIYDVLDNLKIFSNYCREMEADHLHLLKSASLVLYTSYTMLEQIDRVNKQHMLIENGVWLEDFEKPEKIPAEYQLKTAAAGSLKVGYHGVISELLDYSIIEDLLKRGNTEVFMIGPVAAFSGENNTSLQKTINRLNVHKNFHLLGFIPYDKLKYYVYQFDFCLIPFVVNESTDAVSPLKLFEYLACGRPVVATPTKTLLKYNDLIHIKDRAGFAEFFASGPAPVIDKAKYEEVVRGNTWTTMLAPLVNKLNSSLTKDRIGPALLSKPIVDIVNVNFYDWDGEVLYKGGAERYVFDLARLCQSMNLEVRILQNANAFFVKSFEGLPVIGIPARSGYDMGKLSAKYNTYCEKTDLIIASPLDLACGLHYNNKSIGINHGIYWDDKFTRLGQHDINRYEKTFEAIRRCAKTVCVDTNFINWLRTYDWQMAQKCEFIPNYIDPALFYPTVKIFDEELVILYPRRLYDARGLYLTIEAFKYLLPKYPNISLHFVGQASGEDVVATQAFQKRFTPQVKWYELEMEHMQEAYQRSHIALIPTMYAEGTSFSCIEAMATHNAVIATTIGGLPNLILNNFNGILISPDTESLIKAIEKLIHNRALLKQLAENALLTAKSFEKKEWTSRWSGLIEETLSITH